MNRVQPKPVQSVNNFGKCLCKTFPRELLEVTFFALIMCLFLFLGSLSKLCGKHYFHQEEEKEEEEL
jgi:hypothetical protein